MLGEHPDWSQRPLLLLLLHFPPEHRPLQAGEGGARGLREKHQGQSGHSLTRTTSHLRGSAGSCGREHCAAAGGQTFHLLCGSPLRVSLPLPERNQRWRQESRLAPLSVPVSSIN